jgi:histidine kinase
VGGEVIVSAARIKSEILITIRDTGIGLSAEQLPHIFNRFYRSDKSRARANGGSGIGLTIAQALVKAHHGRIWVESEGEGKGSSFHFTLPIGTTSI